jgi:hypothetical protein
MKVSVVVMTAFVFCASLSAQVGLTDRGGPENAAPPQGVDALPIVEAVGCLAEGPNRTWTLTNAAAPTLSARAGFSRAEEVKAAEGRGLGSQQFRLIGMTEMNPSPHRGRKVLIKGLLIKDAGGDRINVTSLKTVGEPCGK